MPVASPVEPNTRGDMTEEKLQWERTRGPSHLWLKYCTPINFMRTYGRGSTYKGLTRGAMKLKLY